MPDTKGVSHEHPDVPLQQYTLSGISGLYYVPDYLTTSQQDRLLESLQSSKSKWTQVILAKALQPRVQTFFYGTLAPYSTN